MTYQEIFMEVVYQASLSASLSWPQTPIVVLLTNKFGFCVYPIHMAFAIIEVLLVNYAVQLKFCSNHQLMHDIKPLYHITHIEHHICKGIYPTTPGVGLWEQWCSGPANLFCDFIGMNSIPFLHLHMGNTGANLVIHTMWPHPKLLQW